MERQRIIARVKIKLEEFQDIVGQIVENPLIDELLDETSTELQLLVPRYLLETKELVFGDSLSSQVTSADGTGYLILPEDFLRLSYFKMTEWIKPVFVPITEEHPDYVLQHNNYLRGKPAKPVCVLRWDDEQQRMVMEYYSVVTDHTIERAAYVPTRVAEEVQENLIDPLTWLVTAKILQIYASDEKSEQKARDRVTDWVKLHER
jgi:hypothetical protein